LLPNEELDGDTGAALAVWVSVGIAISVVPRDKVEYYPGCFFSAGVDATIASEAVSARLSEVRAAIDAATGR